MSGSQQLLLGTGVSAVAANYIEDVFSTYLYTGNNSTQTITNGIDLSTKGGLVWIKNRTSSEGGFSHMLYDTNRGRDFYIRSNETTAQTGPAPAGVDLASFNTNGFTLGSNYFGANFSAATYASWTFRKQAKFFDVVTWTGNDATNRQISHNLGSVPGCIIIKNLSVATNWAVWHRSVNTSRGVLNLTDAFTTTNAANYFGDGTSVVQPTSTNFTIGGDGDVNNNGNQFVAYLFAHDAGGFGLTGTDNVISCGSVSGSSTVNLGWEPQWLLVKYTAGAGQDWGIVDNMRGVPTPASGNTPYAAVLNPNLSNAESTSGLTEGPAIFNATGFRLNPNTTVAGTHIYIAIRRGPMKTPTSGTSVFATTQTPAASAPYAYAGFPVDVAMKTYQLGGIGTEVYDRLRGWEKPSGGKRLITATTAAEANSGSQAYGDYSTGWFGSTFTSNVFWMFRRAPGFMDVVCYTGDATNGRSITHNLGVVPEIVIVKKRSSGAGWPTLITSAMRVMEIDNDLGYKAATSTKFYYGDGSSDIAPTSSVFTVASGGDVNGSGSTYVAYLFASVAGVSKVGTYTGTGALQTVNCGFTGGARFVLIKRTDSTGGWFVYDSARGISSGSDPYLLLDVTDPEVTGTNYVDTTGVGFQVTAAAPAELNANGGSYIFLAVA